MSPAGAVDQVKTRLLKLKRSATFSKLRGKRKNDKNGSEGRGSSASLGESQSQKEVFVGANKRSTSMQSFGDVSQDGRSERDDASSMHSVRTQASSSRSVANSEHRSQVVPTENVRGETRSVGGGSYTATLDDSLFLDTPEQSYADESVYQESPSKENVPERHLHSEDSHSDVGTSETLSIPEIVLNSEMYHELEQPLYSDDDEPPTFAPNENEDEEIYSPPLSFLGGPLDTIYEVDSCVGSSQAGMSAMGSSSSRCYSQFSEEEEFRSIIHSRSDEGEMREVIFASVPGSLGTHLDSFGDSGNGAGFFKSLPSVPECLGPDGGEAADELGDPADFTPRSTLEISTSDIHPHIERLLAVTPAISHNHVPESLYDTGTQTSLMESFSVSASSFRSSDSSSAALLPSVSMQGIYPVRSISEGPQPEEQDTPSVQSAFKISNPEPHEHEHEHQDENLPLDETSYSRSMSDISDIDFFSTREELSHAQLVSVLFSANGTGIEQQPFPPEASTQDIADSLAEVDSCDLLNVSHSGIFTTSTPASCTWSLPTDTDLRSRSRDLEDSTDIDVSVVRSEYSTYFTASAMSLPSDSSLRLSRPLSLYRLNPVFGIAHRSSMPTRPSSSCLAALPSVYQLFGDTHSEFLPSSPFPLVSELDELLSMENVDDVD